MARDAPEGADADVLRFLADAQISEAGFDRRNNFDGIECAVAHDVNMRLAFIRLQLFHDFSALSGNYFHRAWLAISRSLPSDHVCCL